MAMLQLAGGSAFSAFRLAKLNETLCRVCPSIEKVVVRWIHFVHHDQPLDDCQQGILEALPSFSRACSISVQRKSLLDMP